MIRPPDNAQHAPTPGHERHTYAMLLDYIGDPAATITFMGRLAGQIIAMPPGPVVERMVLGLSVAESLSKNPTRPNCERLAALHGVGQRKIALMFRQVTGRGIAAVRQAAIPPELGSRPVTAAGVKEMLRGTGTKLRDLIAKGIVDEGIFWDGHTRWNRDDIERVAQSLQREQSRIAQWKDSVPAEQGELSGGRPVVCWETGAHFASQSAAARWAGVDQAGIWAAVKLGRQANGFHFYEASVPEAERPALTDGGRHCWVEVEGKGPVFLELKQAGEWAQRYREIKLAPEYVSRRVGRGEPVCGVVFRRVPLARRRDVVHRIAGMRETGRPTAFGRLMSISAPGTARGRGSLPLRA